MTISHYKNTRGSALVVSLSILLVLTILGVSAMRTISLEERMAGNMRDYHVAFEAAEAAARAGETYLVANFDAADFTPAGGGSGFYTERQAGDKPAWQDDNKWLSAIPINDPKIGSTFQGKEVARMPELLIQKVTESDTAKSPQIGQEYGKHTFTNIHVYQVTGRGFGISPNSVVYIQSHFGIR